jgi:hypothetical protein
MPAKERRDETGERDMAGAGLTADRRPGPPTHSALQVGPIHPILLSTSERKIPS